MQGFWTGFSRLYNSVDCQIWDVSSEIDERYISICQDLTGRFIS